MKIALYQLTPYTLPLRKAWRSGRQNISARSGWLLELETADGLKGYGDCAPLPKHGTETEASALTMLKATIPRLAGIPICNCLDLLPDAKYTPSARCAMETAILDLLTKQRGISLHRWLNPEAKPRVNVNAAIGTLHDKASQRAAAAIEHGYSLLKLKVGIAEPQQELDLLTKLCSNLPSSVQLRVDANRAWNSATAQAFINSIQGLPIESLEEPLAKPGIPNLIQLQECSNITLALDETLAELDMDKLSLLQPLRRIVLKPMLLGGLLPTLRLGQRAQELGIEVVVTTTIDSAAGVWAATQLAAALDTEAKLHHGLGTGEWLRQDLGTGPNIRNGTIAIPPTSGLGFIPYA